jgi:uncharacterized protein
MSLKVAVIGSGMAGLAAARGCHEAGFDVTMFESCSGFGMSAHSMQVEGGIVDVPLRVMGEGNWQHTLALARRMGMGTFAADVRVSCNWMDRRTWFRSAHMPLTGWPMFGSWRHVGPRGLRLGIGLLRLARRTRRLRSEAGDMLLDEFAWRHAPDRLFWRGLVLPILSTICTCDEEHLDNWPATQLLELLDDVLHSGELVRLDGGTARLAEALGKGIHCINGSEVRLVRQLDHGIEVVNASGEGGRYDRVIVATQANQLDFLDLEQFGEERGLLAGIRYANGELVVHRDERFMPARKSDWCALNFMMDRRLEDSMFTVWVNAVEPSLEGKPAVFQTWNPRFEPLEDQVIARVPMQRAVVTRRTDDILEQVERWHDRPDRRLFYCGSWAHPGVPLLETAVRSAEAVVARLSKQSVSGPSRQVASG